jgi:HSP20 family protein
MNRHSSSTACCQPSLSRGSDLGRLLGGNPIWSRLVLEATTRSLAVDTFEDSSNYYARFELPGVAKDKLHLEVEDKVLSVRVDPAAESDLVRHRRLSLPDGVQTDAISANLELGLLTLTLPKAEQSRLRKISVN